MNVNRRVGDRLQVELLAIGSQRPSIHKLIESNLLQAWGRVSNTNDPRLSNPRFIEAEHGWLVLSSLTGEHIAKMSLVPPAKGRPRP